VRTKRALVLLPRVEVVSIQPGNFEVPAQRISEVPEVLDVAKDERAARRV
jgi:hypothetical protein